MKQKEFYNLYDEFNRNSNMKIPTGPGNSLSDLELLDYLSEKYIPIFKDFMEKEDLSQEIYIELIHKNKINHRARTDTLRQTLYHIYNKYEEQKYYNEVYEEPYYIDNIVHTKLIGNTIDNVFQTLVPRENLAIQLRYGLYDGKENTLDEIAKELDKVTWGWSHITRERVRQIEMKAFRKLKHPSRAKPLRELKIALETGYDEL